MDRWRKMSNYKKIPIWENRKRLKLLIEFRNLMADYFNNIKIHEAGVRESSIAYSLRPKINLCLETVCSFVKSTGINSEISHYYDISDYIRKEVGSDVESDVLRNIFIMWDKFRLNEDGLLDYIDRAIGIYKYDKLNAIFRTINPLFWIGLLLDYIVSLPFKIIGRIGFNQKKIESSVAGRISKGILYFITVIAAIITLWDNRQYFVKLISIIKD